MNRPWRTVTFTGKGTKGRTAPLNDEAFNTVQELAGTPAEGGYLFHSRTGHNLPARDGTCQLAVRRAKISDLHFHDLRRTFSTHVKRLTDAFTVKESMGHDGAQMTDGYTMPPLEDMRGAAEGL